MPRLFVGKSAGNRPATALPAVLPGCQRPLKSTATAGSAWTVLLEGVNHVGHGRVNVPVGGENAAATGIVRTTTQIRHLPACFLDQECTGRHVPRVQRLLPEAVQASGGNIAEV